MTPTETVPAALEPLRGVMRAAARSGFAGAQGLVLPLLWSIATNQQSWSLGPFGESWWVVLATSLAGGYLLVRALVQLTRSLRAAAALVRQGYPWRGVLAVALDDRNEIEPLFEGRRRYASVSASTRDRIARLRSWEGVAYVAAMLWTPFAFALLVVSAAHFGVSQTILWVGTLVPTAALIAVAQLLSWQERRLVVSSSDDADEHTVLADWFLQSEPDAAAARQLTRAAKATTFVAFVSFFPIPTLVLAAAFAPTLADIGIPNMKRIVERAAHMTALEEYRLPVATTVTAADAGLALQTLGFVGHALPAEPPLLEPARRYAAWLPEDVTVDTTTELFRRAVRNGLTAAEMTWIEPAALHPAHAAVAALARAPGLEYGGTIWPVPLPSEMTLGSLPVLPRRTLGDVLSARRARIALLLSRNDVAGAEMAARELVSAGLLLSDHGFALFDNLVGQQIARRAGRMLEQVYEATSQDARATTLRKDIQLAERNAHVAQLGSTGGSDDRIEFMSMQRDVVADSLAVRGLRWEFFISSNTVASCLNLNRLIYGAEVDHDVWIRTSRDMLVRTTGEAQLFRFARHGFFGTADGWPVSWRGRLISLGLAGQSNIARCMSLLDAR